MISKKIIQIRRKLLNGFKTFLQRNRWKYLLLGFITLGLCLVATPIFAKLPERANSLILDGVRSHPLNSPQIAQQTNIINSNDQSLEPEQNLEAAGFYRRACWSLVQALAQPDLNCKSLINDEDPEQQLTRILKNVPATPTKVELLTKLGNVLRMSGGLESSKQILNRSLEIAIANPPMAPYLSEIYLNLANTERALGKRAENFDEENYTNFYQTAWVNYQQSLQNGDSNLNHLRAKLNQFSLLTETQLEDHLDFLGILKQDIQSQINTIPSSLESTYARIDFAKSLTCLKLQAMSETERSQLPFPNPPIANLCALKPQPQAFTVNSSIASAVPNWLEIAELLGKAYDDAKQLNDVRSQSYALGNLGELYELTQQWEHAETLTQEALQIADKNQALDIAYRWQWQLGRLGIKTQKPQDDSLGFYAQSFENLKELRKDLVTFNSDTQFNFRDEVEPVYRQFVELLLQTDAANPEPTQKNLTTAREVIETLQLAEISEFFRENCAANETTDVDEIVDESSENVAVIYPIILERKLAVILKLPKDSHLRYHEQNLSRGEIENHLNEFYKEVRRPHRSVEGKKLSQELYDWLIRPAQVDLEEHQIKSLVFVLDGLLRNLPMAALHDSEKYLIEKYAVAVAPALQVLAPETLELQNLEVLAAGISEPPTINGKSYLPIPNAQKEIEVIKKYFPNQSFLNEQFTKINLEFYLNSTPFSIIHIATHGKFDANPANTYLVVWDHLLKIKELDYLLRSTNQQKDKKLDLLILSACDTGKGDRRATLGLAGIAARAGSRSILASLWRVSDESAPDLMREFYNQLKINPTITKAEALRQAQLKIMKENTPSYPYKWAPYILVGNWQ